SEGQNTKEAVQDNDVGNGQTNAETATPILTGKEASPSNKEADTNSQLTSEGTYSAKAKTIADKIRNTHLPSWLGGNDPNITANGVTANSLKNALADAVELVGKLLDGGVELKKAISQALVSLKKHYADN
ncbi:hypothetical protein QUS97_22805, partial [Xanthomonas citri pv. citri]